MGIIKYYSTNNKSELVNFETALLRGMAPDYGLYMIARDDIPKLSPNQIKSMKEMSYAEIAFQVLHLFLQPDIPALQLKELLNEAYHEEKIPTIVQHVVGKKHILWLTKGPTYSFKDYAARFFGRALSYFIQKRDLRRTVVVATSGDTGGAVADALHNLDNIDCVLFFPKGAVSEGQRRQMTTLGGNVYAFEVNGDFDVCQALAKNLLGDKKFAETALNDANRLTSANSISIGRMLPQAVYPFFAYSRIAKNGEEIIASIPSGNFGDMMGTVIAKEMGLPVSKILCGVNENTEFPEFLETGQYIVRPSKKSPSSAMIVSHPSNLARLFDFYGGHMFDERDPTTKQVIKAGVIDRMPDMSAMRKDIFSVGVTNEQHYKTMKEVFLAHGVILDPHGAVGWRTLELFQNGKPDQLAVVYETADPGKFPQDVKKAIGKVPDIPDRIKMQANIPERIFSITSEPQSGQKVSGKQLEEAKSKIAELLSKSKP